MRTKSSSQSGLCNLQLLAAACLCLFGSFLAAVAFAAGTPSAAISLVGASAKATQTGDSSWKLEKTGAFDQLNSNVIWNVAATRQTTIAHQLIITGTMTVQNSGFGPATIGNIVVNLQKRVNTIWTTISSDVADATNGDAATTAKIHGAASSEHKSSFTENNASGELEFMDATNNTIFSLVPEKTIPAGQSRTLLFQATFKNNVLNLANGTAIRSEVIVSFGNATATGNSTANVDINGNGQIDPDEAHVRSVPARVAMVVPPQINGNATPTLSDTPSDI